ncbi:CPBP family intramembrane glutamic endopeptidase [Metabacillus fastidiosus]|uniref:CPBP family intramembrane glutamic endopeptidase n=1 Tax=Metabacillus fastidiosus TaxID=1458 RepID=UPI003D2BEE41
MFELMSIRNFLFSGIIFFCALVLGYIFILEKPPIDDPIAYLYFSYGLLSFFPLLWFFFQFKKQKIASVVYTKGFIQHIPIILLLIVILFSFSSGTVWLTDYILSFIIPDYVEESFVEEDLNGMQFLLSAIQSCVIGAAAEEFIFRGLLLKRLASKTTVLMGAILSSLLFGILHYDIIGSFVFGFIMSILYLKSGNLLLPITIHILYNTAVTILPEFPKFTNITTISDLHTYMIPNLIMLLISVLILTMYIKRNIKNISSNEIKIFQNRKSML